MPRKYRNNYHTRRSRQSSASDRAGLYSTRIYSRQYSRARTACTLYRATGATAPVLDTGTCSQVSTYLQAAVSFFEAAKSEASSTDTWAVMKIKIAALAATVATNTAISDPSLKQEIAGLQSLIVQILGVQ